MAGLLGGYMDPQQMGLLGLASSLLAASGPSRTPISLGQAFGQGLLSGNQLQQQAAQMQMRDKLAQAQLDEVELNKQAQALELARQAAARQIIGTPTVPELPFTDYPTMPGEAPIPGLLSQVGQEGTGFLGGKIPAQEVPLQLAGLGGEYTKSGLKAISDQAMWDRMAQLFGNGGGAGGLGTKLTVGPRGPEVTFDPAAAATVRLREAELRDQGIIPGAPSATAPTASPGVPGGLSPKQQRELAAERAKNQPAAKRKVDSEIAKANIIQQKIEEAVGVEAIPGVREGKEGRVGFFSTGFIGKLLSGVAGTDAYNLERITDTIKANLGFSELQAMREASPTGGALGQVAVQELNMLQSTLASLDVGQDEAQLRQNLQSVLTHFNNWKEAVQQSYNETYGTRTLIPKGTTAADVDAAASGWSIRKK